MPKHVTRILQEISDLECEMSCLNSRLAKLETAAEEQARRYLQSGVEASSSISSPIIGFEGIVTGFEDNS